MTSHEHDQNKDILVNELLSIGRPGMVEFIRDITVGGFFEASCKGHDRNTGGTVNHSLWTLKIARQIAENLTNPTALELKDSITVVCLLHDLCDMRHFQKVNNPDRRHGSYSTRIMASYGELFTKEELSAVNCHMHDSLIKGGPKSSLSSLEHGTLLHAILRSADHKSIEFANNIPFTTEPSDPIAPRCVQIPCSLYFDKVENKLWLDDVGINSLKRTDGTSMLVDDLATLHGTISLFAWMRNHPLEADITVVKNDDNRLAILTTTYLSGFGMPTVSMSDHRCFGYLDITFYVSNYPDFRSSYIIAQVLNGKWGAAAYKVSIKQKPMIIIFPQVDYIYSTEHEAIDAIRHGRKQFRRQIDNPMFYRRYSYSEMMATKELECVKEKGEGSVYKNK